MLNRNKIQSINLLNSNFRVRQYSINRGMNLNGMEEEELEQKFFLALGILLISDDKINVY